MLKQERTYAMLTCTKVYHDVPFAHRQHLHDGHCSFVHGHNWDIAISFACREPDSNGFVVDFGKLGFIKDWITEHLDHACVFSESDPLLNTLVSAAPEAWKVYTVRSCSCEGLAAHLFEVFDEIVRRHTDGRVWVEYVEISEDKKNRARFSK